MKKLLTLTLLIAASCFFVGKAMAETPLLIYGAPPRGQGTIFLGCINCNRSHPSSLANSIGDYGSRISDLSIYNRIGDYGSRISDVSACNSYASSPPIVVNGDGDVVGYLTVNRRTNGVILDPRIIGACQ